MSDKPEALKLAESAHLGYRIEWQVKAAAELRRLHGIELALRDCEMALAKMTEKYMGAADRRDELLEALKLMRRWFLDTDGTHSMWQQKATDAADAVVVKAMGDGDSDE